MDVTRYFISNIVGAPFIGSSILLGRQSEYGLELQLDYSTWIDEFGSGSVGWIVRRPTDTGGYLVPHSEQDGISTFILTATETEFAGYGEIEVFYIVEGQKRISKTATTLVLDSMMDSSEVPAPWQSYIDQVHEDAMIAVEAKDLIENMTASASADDTYGTPDVEVTKETVDDHYNFDFAFTGIRGNGITGISLVSTVGLTKTYRITMDSGSFDFEVTDGNGIANSWNERSGNAVTYFVEFDSGDIEQFTVYDGAGIDHISKTGTSGLLDTYTIYLTNGSTQTFTVHNGNGITDITLNPDYTLTISTNAGDYTTESIRGEKGETGNVMYATFEIDYDNMGLYMITPDGYTGPTFELIENRLYVRI